MGLSVQGVSKTFGERKAVDSISFSIDEPGVFGLIGTNGAGKTTTIRMILGVLSRDEGDITWNGGRLAGIRSALAICRRNGESIPRSKCTSSSCISASCAA